MLTVYAVAVDVGAFALQWSAAPFLDGRERLPVQMEIMEFEYMLRGLKMLDLDLAIVGR